MPIIELQIYLDNYSRATFEDWFGGCDPQAQAKVTIALDRLRNGNDSHVESIDSGVFEVKINWGPGYRVYFGRNGIRIILLLGGSTKQRQNNDIAAAKMRWADYKTRKPQ